MSSVGTAQSNQVHTRAHTLIRDTFGENDLSRRGCVGGGCGAGGASVIL